MFVRMDQMLPLFVITVNLHVPVLTWDIHLHCPADPWISGTETTLTCSLLTASYPSKCTTSHTDQLDFRLTPSSGPIFPACSVNDFTSCTPFPTGQLGCQCVSDNSTMKTFEYKFTADTTRSGSWDCSVPCFAGFNNALDLTTENCDNRGGITQAPPTPESTSTATPDCECECECCDEWVKVVISIAFVTVFSLVCVAILIIIDFSQQVWLFDGTWTLSEKLYVLYIPVVLYVLYIPVLVYIIRDAVRRKWPFDAKRVTAWHVVVIVVCTFIPEFMVVYVICAAILKTWPFEKDKGKAWEILFFVIGFMLCCVWVIYMTIAGTCGFWPLRKKCKCTCACTGVTEKSDESTEAWEIAVFVIGLIFIVGWIVYFIVSINCKWWPFCRNRTSN